MGRSVLPCFHPFSFAGGSPSPLSTQDASAFYSFLSEDLKRLEQSLAEGSVSLQWSAEAMNLLKKMQIELLALFKKSKLPISFGTEEDWFNQYMQETATLLDFCNSLKSAVSRINRYRMLIDLTIHKIAKDDSVSMVSLNDIEFGRLDREHEKFLRVRMMKETVSAGSGIGCEGSKSENSISAVMLVAKITMVVVSLLLVSAIVSPISIDMASGELTSEFPQLKPFMDVLTTLVVRFHERVSKPENGSRLVLVEHEMVDSVVGDLKAQVGQGLVGDKEREGFLRSVGLLRTSSIELREGVEMFDAVVDEVFEVVIRGRNEMLGVFRDGALSVG